MSALAIRPQNLTFYRVSERCISTWCLRKLCGIVRKKISALMSSKTVCLLHDRDLIIIFLSLFLSTREKCQGEQREIFSGVFLWNQVIISVKTTTQPVITGYYRLQHRLHQNLIYFFVIKVLKSQLTRNYYDFFYLTISINLWKKTWPMSRSLLQIACHGSQWLDNWLI